MTPDDEDDFDTTAAHPVELLATYRAQPCLIVLSGTDTGKMYRLSGVTVIGRVDANIVLEGPGISRKHASVTVHPDGRVELADLGSTNGTLVQGVRVETSLLQDGDKVQIGGTTVLKFSYQDTIDQHFQKNLYESATRDGLTRVLNRKALDDALRQEVAHALRRKHQLSVLLLDIDYFKRLNDTYGHLCGDAVLQELAERIRQLIRTEDTLARYGGEEFVVILRETAGPGALLCAERIRDAIARTPFSFNGEPLQVTVSVGVSVLLSSDASNAEELLSAADEAMYRAKQAGRNRVGAPTENPLERRS